MPLPSSRRGFLSGGFESLLKQVAETTGLNKDLAFLGFDRSYVRLRRQAMATDFEVLYCSYEKSDVCKIGSAMLDEVERIESLMSIWKGETELIEVNRRAAQEPVQVSEEIFNLVKLAKDVFSQTEGAYDITSTPLVRCWGFFQRQGRLPSPEEIDEARRKTGMQYVELDEVNRTLHFTREGIELSPASVGKGLALDYAMRIAHNRGLKTVMMHGGFSSVLASGRPAWKDAWQIDVRNPLDHNHPLARLRLKNEGYSTSGAELQYFEHEGKRYGHIIDPRTGWPVEKVSVINVVAPTAAQAELFSTAFYVMGVEKTLEYCDNHKDLGVLILTLPSEDRKAELITSNIREDRVEVMFSSC